MDITVAIPCYNGEGFIGRTIEAVLAQTHPADQVMVIEDGSSDRTAEIIAQYPVQLISHDQNKGLSAGRNTALAHTQTELLAFVDADAYADPGMLAALIDGFDRTGADGVGGQGIEAVQESIYDRWRGLHAFQGYGEHRRDRVEHLYGLCMAYRCTALHAVGGFDTHLWTNAEDVDIGFRLTDKGFHLAYEPGVRVYHQRRDNHASLVKMMHQWYYWAWLVRKKTAAIRGG